MYIIKIYDKINEFLTAVAIHASQAGRSRNQETFPFLTTLAAIMYVMSSTLGSGSYKEVLWNNIGLEIIMYFVLFFISVIFSICLLSYLDSILDFIPTEEYVNSKLRLFPPKATGRILVISITPAVIILSYHFMAVYFDFPRKEILTKIFLFSILFFISILFLSLVERFINGSQTIFISFLGVILVCVNSVLYNVNRDSYKASLNVNGQYCYWLYSKQKSEVENNRLGYSIDDKLCESLLNRGVEFRYIINLKH